MNRQDLEEASKLLTQCHLEVLSYLATTIQ